MRKQLAILFLIIFSFQVLPLKGISKLLCKSQSTEEVQSDSTGDDDDAAGVAALCASDMILSRVAFDPLASKDHFENRISVIIREAEALPFAYISSIPAPPPDLI